MNVAALSSILFATAVLTLTGCGSESADSASTDANDPPPEMQGAEAPGGGEALKISGFFQVDGSQQLNKPASITDDGHTWIQYGVSGAQELNLLFTNSEDLAENGLNIAAGPYTVTATSTSGECSPAIDVTAAKVSGHYSCKGSTGYDKSTGQMGKVDIEVDFEASS